MTTSIEITAPAADAYNLGYSCVTDLGKILKAIAKVSAEGSVEKGLAEVGLTMVADWENIFDCGTEKPLQ